MAKDIMYEMRRRKPEPKLVSTQGAFNLAHHISMVCKELAFDKAISYTQQVTWIPAQLNVKAVQGFIPLSLDSTTQSFDNLRYLSTSKYVGDLLCSLWTNALNLQSTLHFIRLRRNYCCCEDGRH